MRIRLTAVIVTLTSLFVGCSHQPNYTQAAYTAAIQDNSRPVDARARDSYRKPAQVLAFAATEPGDRLVEIAPGGGYYTAILSRVVGDQGHIEAVDPERLFEVFERGREGFPAYIADDPRTNVTYTTQYLDEIKLPPGMDQVWMVLYYHDTLWTGEDRRDMNQRFYAALKPGGRYLVVDHHAKAGAPDSVGQTLHRMDRRIAVEEITAAGFKLIDESQVLSDPDDPRDDSVFDPNRRGKTDRFMLLFEKPHS